MKIAGYIDTIDDDKISGWAIDRDNSSSLYVALFLDDIFYQITYANMFRPDILNKNIHKTGLCGFCFDVKNKKYNKVDIRVLSPISLDATNDTKNKLLYINHRMNIDDFLKKVNDDKICSKNQYNYYSPNNSTSLVISQIKNRDIYSLGLLLNTINYSKNLTLDHPFLDDIKTKAIDSYFFNMQNYVLMSDDKMQFPWILIQCENFIDAIITPCGLFWILINDTVGDYRGVKFNCIDFKDKKVAFLLSQNRPYHYFYDHLKNIISYENVLLKNTDSFYIPQSYQLDDGAIGIFPSTVGNNYFNHLVDKKNIELNNKLEYYIYDNSKSHNEEYDLELYINISCEKRNWLEQLDGYVNIINKFTLYFNKIKVYIDGITIKENEQFSNSYLDYPSMTKETTIANHIKDFLYTKTVFFEIIIGNNYKDKIDKIKNIDCFITNLGTDCFLPGCVLRKYGIALANTKMIEKHTNTFMRNNNLIILDKKFIKDDAREIREDFLSYHIPWQAVFNKLAEILNKTKNMNIEHLDVPPVEEVAKEYENNMKEKQ